MREKKIKLLKVPGSENLADLMTKHLDSKAMAKMISKMGLNEASRRSLIAPKLTKTDSDLDQNVASIESPGAVGSILYVDALECDDYSGIERSIVCECVPLILPLIPPPQKNPSPNPTSSQGCRSTPSGRVNSPLDQNCDFQKRDRGMRAEEGYGGRVRVLCLMLIMGRWDFFRDMLILINAISGPCNSFSG